jgi:CubicO group peptidase (beta-lactamase class C family)
MKRKCLLLFILVFNVVYSQNPADINTGFISFDNTYKAPVFSDSERIVKVKNTFPIVEKIYKEFAEKRKIPGMTFSVMVDGIPVYTGNCGYMDIAGKKQVDNETRFRIASMSKSFTAMAILKLRDEGKLRLDDPAYLFIPEMKGLNFLTNDSPPITIRNLLNHTAGFPEDNPWGDRQLAHSDEDLLKLIRNGISFSNVPGLTHEYSNLGFTLLGKIISNITGTPFQNYINENILKPLGMINTVWEYTKVPYAYLAKGYRWQGEQWIEEPLLHDGVFGSMGGLITTVDDFNKYMAFHLSAYPPGNDNEGNPVKKSSLREMHQPAVFMDFDFRFKFPGGKESPMASGYGFGLMWSKDSYQRIYVGHGGGLPGFGSHWRIMPDYGIGLVVFGNLTYAGFGSINLMILDTIISTAKLQPRLLPVSDILEKRKNELIKILPDFNDAERSGIFAENFFMDNSPDSLKNRCKMLFNKAGDIKNIRKMEPENQLRGSFIMEGNKGNILIYFTLTPENPPLIQQMNTRFLSTGK